MDAQTISNINRAIGGIHNQLNTIQGILNGLNSPNTPTTGPQGNNGNNNVNQQNKGLTKAEKEELARRRQLINSLKDATNAVVDFGFTLASTKIDIKIANISAASELFVNNMALASKSLSLVTKGILATDPKQALNVGFENVKGAFKLTTESIKTQNKNLIIEQQKEINIRKAENERILSAVSAIGSLGVAVGSIVAMANPIGLAGLTIISAVSAIGSVVTNITKQSLSYQVKQMEYDKLVTERRSSIIESISDAIEQVSSEWLDKSKEIIDKNIMLNNESYKLGRIFGYTSNNMQQYEQTMLNVNKAMALFGGNIENYIKLQQGYISKTGRNAVLSESDATGLKALGFLWGLSEEETSGIAGGMQIFNKSAEDSAEIVFEMGEKFQIMGLSQQKFAKDLVNNLKLAQKYDFKNGTKGLMEMMRYAQSVRMDMTQMDTILSGFHTGNIEDVITKAAQLNVLGGNAALISDPIGMLYDAYANPQGMLNRVVQSISGMGFFNTKTGETEFGIAERMRIEQMAKAYGVSPETLTEMARQENKGRELNRLYGEGAFGKYGDLIKQNAFYENGEWKVNMLNGQTMSLSAVQGNEKLLSEVMPNSAEEQLVSFAQKQLSTQEKIEKNTAVGVAGVMSDTYTDTIQKFNEYAEGIKTQWERFSELYSELVHSHSQNVVDTQEIINNNTQASMIIAYTNAIIAQSQSTLTERLRGEGILKNFNAYLQNNPNNPNRYKNALNIATDIETTESTSEKSALIYDLHKTNLNSKAKERIESLENQGIYLSDVQKGQQLQIYEAIDNYLKNNSETGNDFVITPSGKVVKPDSQDFHLLMKQGGDIQRMLGGSQSNDSNTPRSVNVTGSLYLNTDGQSVDLVELINKNPEAFYRVTRNILFPNQGQSRVNV